MSFWIKKITTKSQFFKKKSTQCCFDTFDKNLDNERGECRLPAYTMLKPDIKDLGLNQNSHYIL